MLPRIETSLQESWKKLTDEPKGWERETLMEGKTLSDTKQVAVVNTYSDDVSCCVLTVCLVILLRWVCLLQGLQFQLWGQEGAEIWDGAWSGCYHWQHRHTGVTANVNTACFQTRHACIQETRQAWMCDRRIFSCDQSLCGSVHKNSLLFGSQFLRQEAEIWRGNQECVWRCAFVLMPSG